MTRGSTIYGSLLRLTGRAAWCAPAGGSNPLRRVEADIIARYQMVQHAPPEYLGARVGAGREQVALFDVRAAVEFAVSHIEGAVRLDPAIRARDFRASYAKLIVGRDVFVYCAIGLRSARLVKRLQPVMIEAGARSVTNLSGGLFRWHNEGRPLLHAAGDRRAVHPFNAHWARFLLANS